MNLIASKLIAWFLKNKRDLPWREDHDWYKIFLSEFLLQQTQMNQALPYFQKIMERFPTIFQLANAREDEVLGLWAGLGYYARARHLLKAAKQIVNEFNGHFPTDLKTALKLPGIGPYTAAAILSIAFNKPLAVVDGNVVRVITRLFAIEQDVRKSSTQKIIKEKVSALIPAKKAALFNEALMEFGALVCKSTSPLCVKCPLQKHCLALASDKIPYLPYKAAAPKKQKKFHLVLVLNQKQKLLLVQRNDKGMFAKMWEFPVIEVFPTNLNDDVSKISKIVQNSYPGLKLKIDRILPVLKQTYSHIDLQYQPILAATLQINALNSTNYLQKAWFHLAEIENLAMHKAHQTILQLPAFKEWWENP